MWLMVGYEQPTGEKSQTSEPSTVTTSSKRIPPLIEEKTIEMQIVAKASGIAGRAWILECGFLRPRHRGPHSRKMSSRSLRPSNDRHAHKGASMDHRENNLGFFNSAAAKKYSDRVAVIDMSKTPPTELTHARLDDRMSRVGSALQKQVFSQIPVSFWQWRTGLNLSKLFSVQ